MKGITPKQALRGGSEFAGKLFSSDLGGPEFQGLVEDLAKMDAGMGLAVEAFISAMRNPSANSIMASKTKSGITVAKHEMATIEMAPVEINHDQTVEKMIIMEKGFNNTSYIKTKHFPNVNGTKLGSEVVNLLLVRPVPPGEVYSTEKVLALIDGAGFVPEDIPALSPLKAKEHADELWEAGVRYITALGENSRWQDSYGYVRVAYLRLDPDFRGFKLFWLVYAWDDDDWFVVRRK